MQKGPATLEAMRARHAFLEAMIKDEYGRPRPDDAVLKYLKLEKLHVKEQIDEALHH